MCEACNYYLFSTDDPFRSVGWNQSDLFQLVVKKNFGLGYSKEKIAALLLDAASGGLSRESLHICQESVLVAELKISDVKYMAIELAETASGIEYYFQNCERRDKEITLYCALDIIDWVEDDALWIKVYEYGIGKKIEPRDYLTEKYKQLTEDGEAGDMEEDE